jgi:thiol-disulfide isomerase/thioredoxin
MHSADTVDEINYAVSLERPGLILPTYWEDPLPRSPAEELPPPAIERLQFHRIYPGAISEATFRRKTSPLVVWAPAGSEVFIDDEFHGTTGTSGRLIIRSLKTGKHVLRIARAGYRDDERIVEVHEGVDEQVIQSQFQSHETIPGAAMGTMAAPSEFRSVGAPAARHDESRSGFASADDVTPTAELAPIDQAVADTAPLDDPSKVRASLESRDSLESIASPPPFAPSPGLSTGAAPPPSEKCSRCGGRWIPGQKFCSRCGHSAHEPAVQHRPINQPLSPSPHQATSAAMYDPMETIGVSPPRVQATFSPPPHLPAVAKRKFPIMPIYAGAAVVLFAVIVAPVWFLMSNRSNLVRSSNTNSGPNATPLTTSNKNANANNSFESLPFSKFKSLEGGTVPLEDLHGRVVLVNFWGTGCAPCRTQIPTLNELQKTFEARGVTVIGITYDDTVDSVRNFQKQTPQDFRIGFVGREMGASFESSDLPATYILDRRGRVRKKMLGLQSRAALEAAIEPLINETVTQIGPK